ncbi:hypothetical protein ACFSKL_14760 [Belliella marina]|uniref:Uncharacterized protein n=1 Tax=Belliella marina TaxID=1644146 RepID=A0ABW4VMX2_9BACT
MENHPRIDKNNTIIKKSKIILGSFPTWALTNPDPEKNETFKEKENERMKNGDLHFFYGSSTNKFWLWYQKYIDQKVAKNDIHSLINSLENNSIGITDVIMSCNRKNKSSLDKHLTNRLYNHHFFQIPKTGGKIKILCTSKGVMNEMLLNTQFFKMHNNLTLNLEKSLILQNQIIQDIMCDTELIKKPICSVINVNSGGTIECIAIPSPGSPYRRLIDFGFNCNDADNFLNNYLKATFKWFSN